MIVVGVVTAVTTVVAVGLSWLVTYPILSGKDMTVDFSSADDQRALIGVVLYLTTVALFSVAVGVLLRSSAGRSSRSSRCSSSSRWSSGSSRA